MIRALLVGTGVIVLLAVVFGAIDPRGHRYAPWPHISLGIAAALLFVNAWKLPSTGFERLSLAVGGLGAVAMLISVFYWTRSWF
jgi:hypothetical protein